MSSETLRENLNAIAEAGGGVVRLRELILQLAVQGKLLAQDPKDAPAASLIERINGRRAELEIAKVIRRRDQVPSLESDDCPWQAPMGWIWVRLGDLCLVVADGPHFSPEYVSPKEGVPFLSTRNVTPRGILLEDLKHISYKHHAEFSKRVKPEPGDILYTKGGTTGIAVVNRLDFEFSVWVHLAVLRTAPDAIYPEYLAVALNSPHCYRQSQTFTHGIGNRDLGLTRMVLMTVPVPPLVEQKRIVAKVVELLALCDELEQKQEQRHTLRRATHISALDALTNAQTPDELAHAWERLQKHWDVLAAHSDAMPPLRQAILQLAVQGRLVPQNPKDEPGSVLLKKIADELANRDDGRLCTYGDGSSIKPFPLPAGWAWASLSQVGVFGRGKSKHRPRNDPALYREGMYPFVQTGDVARAPGVITSYSQRYSELGLRQSRLWPAGTLCITIAANIAESAILGFDACFPDSVVGLEPTRTIGDTKFFSYFLQTARVRLEQFAPATAQKNINLAILDSLAVPIPPLAEQKRIVAKLDELMALCDTLEQHAREQEELGGQLAHAAVAAVATG